MKKMLGMGKWTEGRTENIETVVYRNTFQYSYRYLRPFHLLWSLIIWKSVAKEKFWPNTVIWV